MTIGRLNATLNGRARLLAYLVIGMWLAAGTYRTVISQLVL
ncbi:MAG: hypothetical protein OEQ39_12145 [Gammaproteobacteria bacterium]|nr:hypothetical protein [Gammaproteobacteria bacterium]MDH3466655.1 hypothetical protein [Gammaproteobacteria bacterium]